MTAAGAPVLVATDLAARTDRAVDRAVALAAEWQVRLTVVHVVEPGSVAERGKAAAIRAVRAVLPDPEADVDIMLPGGSAPDAITEAARESGCGIIVTGVARLNSAGDYLLGTAVDHIVRHARVPVLVVKQRAHGPYRRLLVATDLSDCSRAALLRAFALFPQAELHLVHAYHVPYEAWLGSDQVQKETREQAQQEVDAFLAHEDVGEALRGRVQVRLGYGETGPVLAKAITETGVDLVVLGTHGRSGFIHAAIGSMAESLLRWVNVDTLMVRE